MLMVSFLSAMLFFQFSLSKLHNLSAGPGGDVLDG